MDADGLQCNSFQDEWLWFATERATFEETMMGHNMSLRKFCLPNLRQSPLLPAKSSLDCLLDHAIMFEWILMDLNTTPFKMNDCGLPLRESKVLRDNDGPKYFSKGILPSKSEAKSRAASQIITGFPSGSCDHVCLHVDGLQCNSFGDEWLWFATETEQSFERQ